MYLRDLRASTRVHRKIFGWPHVSDLGFSDRSETVDCHCFSCQLKMASMALSESCSSISGEKGRLGTNDAAFQIASEVFIMKAASNILSPGSRKAS